MRYHVQKPFSLSRFAKHQQVSEQLQEKQSLGCSLTLLPSLKPAKIRMHLLPVLPKIGESANCIRPRKRCAVFERKYCSSNTLSSSARGSETLDSVFEINMEPFCREPQTEDHAQRFTAVPKRHALVTLLGENPSS